MSGCRCRFHLGCTVHDEDGKRWDAYTIDDIALLDRLTYEPAQEGWSCYCGRHEATDNELPIGTPCVWRQVSYESNEWECECAESYRDGWLSAQSVDWERMGRASDRRYQLEQRLRRWKWAVVDFVRRWVPA